VDDKIKKLLLA